MPGWERARVAGQVFLQDRLLAGCVAATLLLSALFITFPGIDLAVSELFYDPAAGFAAKHVGVLRTLREVGSLVPLTVVLLLGATLVLKLLSPLRRSLCSPRLALYFVSLYLLGPALLVNGVLKAVMDRPRPVNVSDFGGASAFLPAWHMGGEVLGHRSFVSGEAALVACLLPLVAFVPPARRRTAGLLIGVFVVMVSMNRVAFGGHFLSDVTISIALIATLATVLHRLLYGRWAAAFSDPRMEVRLTRIGIECNYALHDLALAAARRGRALAAAAGRQLQAAGSQLVSAGRLALSFGAAASSAIRGIRVRRLSQVTPNRS
nr:phosphatase PAP2 family protein [Ancylobacter lacus]